MRFESNLNAEELYRIFNAIPSPVYVWKKDENSFKLVSYNHAANFLIRNQMHKFLGKTAKELYRDRADIIKDLKKVYQEKTSFSKEIAYYYTILEKERILKATYIFIPPDIILVSTIDITEEKKVKELLDRSEKEKNIILQTISDHIIFQDLEHSILWCNKAAADSVGQVPENLIGKKCYQVWESRNTACEDCPLRLSIKTGHTEEMSRQTSDGRTWIIKGAPIKNKNNELIGAIKYTHEITELRKSQALLESIFRASPSGIGIVIDRVFIQVNNRFCEMTGYSREELIGQNARMIYPSDKEYEYVGKEKYKQIKKNNIGTVETKLQRKDGTIIDIIMSSSPLVPGEIFKGVTFTATDITLIKKMERNIIESEKKFRSIFDNTIDGIIIIDSKTKKVLLVNKAICDMLSYSESELLQLRVQDIHPKNDLLFVVEQFERQIRGEMQTAINLPVLRKDGSIFYADISSSPITFENKDCRIEVFRDITERRKSEQEKEIYIKFTERSTLAFGWAELDGTIIYGNPALRKILERDTLEDLIGTNVRIYYDEEDLVTLENEILPLVLKEGSWTGELPLKSIEGKITPTFQNIFLIYDDKEKPLYLANVITDITQRKKVEQDLQDSEQKYREAYNRAEFYKDLFAHDINNILQNIKIANELTMLMRTDPEVEKNYINISRLIEEQITRGAKLGSNIRKLSSLEEEEIILNKIDLIPILNEAISSIKNLVVKKNVHITKEYTDKSFFIAANELLIDVFENILNNSIKHNSNESIQISIKVSRIKQKNKIFVRIEIADNGIGIHDDWKESIFQRDFFKEKKGKGLGVGLSLVKKIIDNYGGKIWVEDRVLRDYHQGAKFIIDLPEAE
ncbi:MAG: PAS domain S-box protein [Promethearchaeota archaeon]